MHKKKYIRELTIPSTQKRKGTGVSRKQVRKIQSWLCLHERVHPGIGTMTSIDGLFGPATEKAVQNYQNYLGLQANGIVTTSLFEQLSKPMQEAFESVSPQTTLRDTIIEVANKHLTQKPFELVISNESNSGPWVRSYMDGHEGQEWFWCMGFVQAILDQAFSLHKKSFKKVMPLTYSCDTVGSKGLEKGVLIRNTKIRKQPELVKPGDVMLVRKSTFDWTHTAIIVAISESTFTTIEGNTNLEGFRNGDGVYKRVRNFRKSTLDVFSINRWVV
jgi:peptidoglycan hydrolase-like protein with peptidoglycan-binding domain